MTTHHTKVLIIGGGPAAYTAAIYAARANLGPLQVLGMQPGGQLMVTNDVENYPGFTDPISGPFLMEQMMGQAKNVGTQLIYDTILDVDLSARPFVCAGENGDTYVAETLIIATGAEAKWLGIPSEKKFQGYGVSGCATCDGFFFKNVPVAVVGGGNTAVEEALYLTNHASHVYLIHRRDQLRAEKVLQDRLFKNPKITVLWNQGVDEILGTDGPKSVTGLRIQNTLDGTVQDLEVQGVFVAIGHNPATQLFKGKLTLDEGGYLICNPGTPQTNVPGVFAAGDVQDSVYRQAITAAGQGCMAALEAYRFIESSHD